MEPRASILLIREWEGQTSGSGCCGRLEGDFLSCGDSQPVAAERRSVMERMGPLYLSLRERLGDSAEIEVVDPRNVSLFFLLIRDFWRFRVGLLDAIRTLAGIPVQAVVVNGRVVARGEWPTAEKVIAAAGRGAPASLPS
ncbi:MAG: hypothetical protein PVJ80_14675 [Gemmatimonadota bacterium]|jgi:hypothetical protein